MRAEPCITCGADVLKLPMAGRPNTWIPVELDAYPTADVVEASRWAFRSGHGLVSLDGVTNPPSECLVVHGCALNWVYRGGPSPDQTAPKPPSAAERAAEDVLARGRALGLRLDHPGRRAEQHGGHRSPPHREGTA